MRRWSLAIGLVAVVGLLAAACGEGSGGGAGTPTPKESGAAVPGVASDGELTACMDPSYAPMEFYETPDAADPVGFDVDFATALAKQWGASLRVIPTEFTGLLPALSAGRCDVVISAIFVTPERLATLDAVPYMKTTRVLMVRQGNPDGIAAPEDLAGKTVVTQQGTVYLEELKKFNDELAADGLPKMTIQAYPKETDAVQQLLVGRASALMTQDIEAAFRELESPGEFEVAYRYSGGDVFGIYFSPDQTDLEPAVVTALQTLEQDGTMKSILDKWHMPEELLDV